MNLLRGEIWWVDLNPTRGSEINKKRPCVVLSVDPVNRRRRTVVVVPLTTSPTVRPPLTVAIMCSGRVAVAVIDQVRSTAKERFGTRIGVVTASEMGILEDSLRESSACPDRTPSILSHPTQKRAPHRWSALSLRTCLNHRGTDFSATS